MPSPSRSPAATHQGPGPAGMLRTGAYVLGPVAIRIDRLLVAALGVTMSRRPSPFRSTSSGLSGSPPTGMTTWLSNVPSPLP